MAAFIRKYVDFFVKNCTLDEEISSRFENIDAISRYLRGGNMRVIVTGARGFIGSHLIRRLVKEGYSVIALTRGAAPDNVSDKLIWKTVPNYEIEVLKSILSLGPEVFFHLGWSTIPAIANRYPKDDLLDNAGYGIGLLDLIKQMGLNIRFVFTSSGGTVYGNPNKMPVDETVVTRPMSAYGLSKLTLENYLTFYSEYFGIRGVSLRISNAYGPGQDTSRGFGAVNTFAQMAIHSRPITLFGDGSIVRDYIYVEDVVSALVAAGKSQQAIGPINIGSGIGSSLLDIVNALECTLGRRLEVKFEKSRGFDVPISVLDVNKARTCLGWAPTIDLESGIKRTIDWMVSNSGSSR